MQQVVERPLTRAQQARRQRVIDAAIELATEGGYEAVQMLSLIHISLDLLRHRRLRR